MNRAPYTHKHVDESWHTRIPEMLSTHVLVAKLAGTAFKPRRWVPQWQKYYCICMRMCGVTHLYVGHDSLHAYVWRDLFICGSWLFYVWRDCIHTQLLIDMCDTLTCVTHTRDMTLSYVWHVSFMRVTWLITYVCHGWFMSVTWFINVCDMAHWCVWRDAMVVVSWLIHPCDVTHAYVCHDSFICATWLIHTCDMTESRSEPNPNIKGKCSFVPEIWKSVTFCDIYKCHNVTLLNFVTFLRFCHTVCIFLIFFSKT